MVELGSETGNLGVTGMSLLHDHSGVSPDLVTPCLTPGTTVSQSCVVLWQITYAYSLKFLKLL